MSNDRTDDPKRPQTPREPCPQEGIPDLHLSGIAACAHHGQCADEGPDVVVRERAGALQRQATTPMRKRAYACLLWALETGMRASEICGLQEIQGTVVRLMDTKNGTRRDVPLSARAIKIWKESGPFGITPGTLDTAFRSMTEGAGIVDLHFHDSRHTACTRLSKKLNMLQLTKMLGIKDPRILLVYYNETAEDIAALL